jgi:hypothetical protein
VANTAACADDGSACTSDVCNSGQCTHPDNGTCECLNANDCNDQIACTTDTCSGAGQCSYAHGLENIPAACPTCDDAQNPGDVPKCEEYLQCYITNGCNPNAPCGDNDAICGVNTIGGGQAPRSTAMAVYDCACP